MKKDSKNCCSDCKNGQRGMNSACQLRMHVENRKQQHATGESLSYKSDKNQAYEN